MYVKEDKFSVLRSKVDFLHQIDRDFLTIPHMQNRTEEWAGELFDANVRIGEAVVAHIMMIPRNRDYSIYFRCIWRPIGIFMFHIKILEDSSQLERKEDIQQLDILDYALSVQNSQTGDIRNKITSMYLSPINRGEAVQFISVLDAVTRSGLMRYVSKKLDEPFVLPLNLMLRLLHTALQPFTLREIWLNNAPNLNIIKLLSSKVKDQTRIIMERQFWCLFLKESNRELEKFNPEPREAHTNQVYFL